MAGKDMFGSGPEGPFKDFTVVTPNDSTDLAQAACIRVTGGGTIVVDTVGGDAARTTTLADGEFLLAYCTRVYATGTTATGIEAWVPFG